MKPILAIASSAALAFACASGSSETRTQAGSSPASWGAGATNSPNSSGQVTPTARPPGATASTSTSDNNTGVRTVTGRVAEIGTDSIRLGPENLTLKVDPGTQILRSGQSAAEGLSSLHEGDQVRASFDPLSDRASRIEVLPAGSDTIQGVNGTAPHRQPPAPADDANTTPNPK